VIALGGLNHLDPSWRGEIADISKGAKWPIKLKDSKKGLNWDQLLTRIKESGHWQGVINNRHDILDALENNPELPSRVEGMEEAKIQKEQREDLEKRISKEELEKQEGMFADLDKAQRDRRAEEKRKREEAERLRKEKEKEEKARKEQEAKQSKLEFEEREEEFELKPSEPVSKKELLAAKQKIKPEQKKEVPPKPKKKMTLRERIQATPKAELEAIKYPGREFDEAGNLFERKHYETETEDGEKITKTWNAYEKLADLNAREEYYKLLKECIDV
jgi:hypothetical protein